MTPIYEISVDGTNINRKLESRGISITVTDERGFESDTCEITVDDTNVANRVKFPPTKAKISIKLGYKEKGNVLTGDFVVDGYSHSGAPGRLTIRGKAATQTVTSGLKLRKTRSWHNTLIGVIVTQIAAENGLESAITPAIAAKQLKSVQQSNESSQHFLTRLAERNGAFFKISHDKLLFIQRGKSETVSGKALPSITINRSDGDAHDFDHPEAPKFEGVQAEYRDHKKAKVESVAVGDGNKKTLRKTYKSAEEAKDAAEAEQAKMEQAAETLTLNLAVARAGIAVEGRLNVKGFHPQIDGDAWVVVSVTTTLDDGGLIQSVRAERKIP